jgi:hypothetical protein
MTLERFLLLAGSAAAVLTACSLMTRWDREGLPCDEGRRCDPGYCCGSDDKCHLPEPGVCAICEDCALKACNADSTACLPDTCENRICPVNYQCVPSAGGSACEPVAPNALGRNCMDDAQCGPVPPGARRLCLRGSILAADGGYRNGICAELCQADGGCLTPGVVCRRFTVALDSRATELCLPANAVDPCATDAACGALGHVCTVFDSLAAGPLTACDTPLDTGGDLGAPCARSPTGPLCKDGLCIPTGASSMCSATCDVACASGTCAPVQFGAHYAPMCVLQVTRCQSCSTSTDCGADAPTCVQFLTEQRCVGPCIPDAGVHACPEGMSCNPFPSGTFCTTSSTGSGCP